MPELIRRGLDAPTWPEIKQLLGQSRHTADSEQVEVDVGGVMVSADEIKSALVLLILDRSTNVILVLRRAGHPLAGMDYMQVFEDHRNDHPTLSTPPGTRDQHRGHVKEVVIYYLAQMARDAEGSAQAA